jgi:hypothetical protein
VASRSCEHICNNVEVFDSDEKRIRMRRILLGAHAHLSEVTNLKSTSRKQNVRIKEVDQKHTNYEVSMTLEVGVPVHPTSGSLSR